jgi:succinate dehydrogenase / fumarate reductase iron-sulfur subunit
VEDSRDAKSGERIKKLSEKIGIWDCTHCLECSERCPTEAKPVERIGDLRRVAIEKGVTNNNGARHALGFSKLVEQSGRLDENKLPVMSMGLTNIPGLLELLPIGIRMFLKGKNPPLIHHSIDEVEDVQRICKLIEEQKIE